MLSPLQDSVRVGLVGSGSWSCRGHARLFAKPPFALVSVWSPTDAHRHAAARRLGIASVDSLEDLLDGVHLVAVAVPPAVQPELAARAALCGKALLLEKPLAADQVRARVLAEMIIGRNVSAIVNFPYLHAECMRNARLLYSSGATRFTLEMQAKPATQGSWLYGHEFSYGLLPHALSIVDDLSEAKAEIRLVSWSREGARLSVAAGAVSGEILLRLVTSATPRNTLTTWGADAMRGLVHLDYGDDVFESLAAVLLQQVSEPVPAHESLALGVRVQVAIDEIVSDRAEGGPSHQQSDWGDGVQ